MAGIDYRSIQGPEQVRTDLPDDGAAARAEALRQSFQEFEGISANVYTKARTQAGAIAGAAAGNTGHPDYKRGFERLTAYGQAFNNAATGAYAVQAEAQADDAAARLRVEANNDPNTFRATYGAVRDAVLKTAPAEAQAVLAEVYNRRLAAGMAAISGDQAAEIRNTQRATYDEGVDKQTSRVALLQGSADPHEQLLAQDEQVKLSLLIDGGKNAGLYSKAEAQAMHINAMRQVTEQVFDTQVNRALASPDSDKDVALLLDNFRAAHERNLADTSQPPILSEPEFQKLMSNATTKIREQRLLDMLLKGNNKTAEQARWDAGDKTYTSLLLHGRVTDKMLGDAVDTGDLKPETARALRMQLAAGPVLKSNPKALLDLLHDPRLPGMSDAEIASHPGISNTDLIAAGKEAERQRNSWEGTQQVKDAIGTIGVALKVAPGSLLVSDAEKMAAANATQEFKARLAKLPPEERLSQAAAVAQDVIKSERQREAAADLQDQLKFRDNYIKRSGPGGTNEAKKDAYQARLDQYNAEITRLQAAAKGQ